jgi:alpha-tubulin suppressor-like RCC1 family protein
MGGGPGLPIKSTIAAGEGHALVLSNEGTVEAWGMSSLGQTDVPGDLLNVVEVSSSGPNSLVLLADGTVRAWGYGIDDVPAICTTFAKSLGTSSIP